MATVKSLRIMLYADHQKLSKGLEGAKKKVQHAAKQMAKALALGFATHRIGQTLVASIREAMKQQEWAVDIAVLSGSGSKLFKELREEALNSPFPIEDWMMSGKRLLGAQVPMERVVKILKMLGEMSAGTGSKMNELGLVFTQIWAKGRLQGEEMLQFMERNVSLQKALQKVLGVTKEEMQKMQEAGLITPEHVIMAMDEMTKKGGIFGGMMSAKMLTLSGLTQKMKTNWQVLLADVGSRFIPILNVAAKLMTLIMHKTGLIKGFFAGIQAILMTIGIVLVGIYSLFQMLDFITGGILGWTIGIVAAWAAVGYGVYLVNLAVATLTGGTTIFALLSTGVLGIWEAIKVAVTTATGGLNLLAAGLVAALTYLAWWLGGEFLTGVSDEFTKMTKEAKEIRDAMKDARGQGSAKLLVFGTAELANFSSRQRGRQVELAEKQLAELRMIRENTRKEKEKEFRMQERDSQIEYMKTHTP